MYWCRLRNTSFTLLFTYRTSTYGKVFSFDVRRRTAASTYVDVRWRTCGVWTLHYCIHLYCVYCCSFVMQTRGRMCYLNFLVDRIARPYDRLLASWSRLSVCLWLCALWLNDTSYAAKVSAQVNRNCHPPIHSLTTVNHLHRSYPFKHPPIEPSMVFLK